MGHAKYDELEDLADVLAAVRSLAEVNEPKPGIFYLRRTPFLHFHTREGRRWADAKAGCTWGAELELPFGAGRRVKAAFLREIRSRHRACLDLLSPARRAR